MANFEITREDGVKLPVYFSPENKTSTAAICLFQEWWGLNSHMIRMADRMARAGFRVIVPDFYRGKVAQDRNEASHLFDGLDWEGALKDIQACVNYFLSQGVKKVGVTGFCMGGALSLLAALKLTGISAAVPFYGIPNVPNEELAKIKIPVLGHWAIQDDWCTPEKVKALAEALTNGGVTFTFHSYEAQHAFCNETRPEVFNAAAAEAAMDRTFVFFGQHLLA